VLREPLVLPTAAIGVGIALDHAWPVDAPTLAAAAAALAGLAILALFCKIRRTALAACLIGFVLSGALMETARTPSNPPRLDVPDLSVTILDGCVVQPPALTGDREQFTLEIGRRARARVGMYARPGEELPALHYGQRLEVEGRLRGARNFGNPEAFDYRNLLARQNVYWSLSALSVKPLPGTCGNWFDGAIARMRSAALDRIAILYKGNRYNTAMMDQVLIGEGSGLDRIWTEQYRSTGTFHALIVEGFHVAVLAAAFLFLLRVCFVPRPAATVLTLTLVWIYALVTGWQVPAVRSASGMTLFAVGSLFYRDRRLLNLLAGIALFYLLLDPEQILGASFQLSFLAVAFLAVFAVPFIERTSEPLFQALRELDDTGRDVHQPPRVAAHRVELRLYAETLSAVLRMPARAGRTAVVAMARTGVFFFDLLVVSAVMQVGLALPMAIYFHRVSLTGISANAIVVPLLGLAVPVGFLALFTNFAWIAWLAALLLDLSRRAVEWHARIEPNWRIPDPPALLSFAICAALAVAAIRWKRAWPRWAAAGAVAILLGVLILYPFAPHLLPHDVELTAIDVGQGDSIFLAFPDGKTMLVDAGGFPSFGGHEAANSAPSRMDIGEDVVAPYLWTRALRGIDVVAISHLHSDHVGGMPAILNDFAVGELWVGATPDCEIWRTIQAIAHQRGTRIRRFQRGAELDFGGTHISVLEPSADYQPGPEPQNNDSLVLRIVYGARSLLLTGDMEKPVEWDVAFSTKWPHADILKVGHHGSKTSSTPEFLDQVHPALAVISDGYGNMYGHPHAITLEHLRERHILTYRTDVDGLTSIFTDGQRIW
jgi:competence protein ComEC